MARLEEPVRSCRPRTVYAVAARKTKKPMTRLAIKLCLDKAGPERLTEHSNDLTNLSPVDRGTQGQQDECWHKKDVDPSECKVGWNI